MAACIDYSLKEYGGRRVCHVLHSVLPIGQGGISTVSEGVYIFMHVIYNFFICVLFMIDRASSLVGYFLGLPLLRFAELASSRWPRRPSCRSSRPRLRLCELLEVKALSSSSSLISEDDSPRWRRGSHLSFLRRSIPTGVDLRPSSSFLDWRRRDWPRRFPLRPLLSELVSRFDLFPSRDFL